MLLMKVLEMLTFLFKSILYKITIERTIDVASRPIPILLFYLIQPSDYTTDFYDQIYISGAQFKIIILYLVILHFH